MPAAALRQQQFLQINELFCPSENTTLNWFFLHCDVTVRPYQIEDFMTAFQAVGILKDVLCVGTFQKNHLWIVTLVSLATKRKMAQLKKNDSEREALFGD